MDVRLPDGTVVTNVPDGVTQTDLMARVGRASAPAKPPAPLTKDTTNPIDEFLIGKLAQAPGLGNAPDPLGTKAGRFILGMADQGLGALQLGAHYSTAALMPGVTNAIDQKIKEINDRTQQLRGGSSAGIDWARIAGNVASPVALAAASKIPLSATYGGKVGQGALLGAAAGATSPVENGGEDFNTQKAIQTGAGAAIGAAVPAVTTPIAGIAKNVWKGFVEPKFMPANTRGRVYLEAAGDKADEVVNALRNAKPIVPGSAPTAGEAAVPAGSAEFSSLQKQAADIAPTPYAARADAQNAARLASLRTVGQDEAALQSAQQARKAATDPMYAAATAKGGLVDTFPVKAKVDALLASKPGNAELVSELGKVRKGLLYANGQLRTDAEQVSSVIDGLKTAIAKEDNKFIAGTLNSLKTDLEKALPGYSAAQKTFREMSAPVNQMQVGQYLEKKLVPALSDEAKQRAATYAGALQDATGTIKRATGAPRFDDLAKILTPDQMKVVNGIRDELAQGARFEELARKGSKASPDITSPAGKQRITGMFSRAVTIANEVIGRLEGKVNKKIAAEIAMEMLNPAQTAETMAQAQARALKNKAAATIVEKSLRGGTTTAISAAERK